jgi:hypothetical protein
MPECATLPAIIIISNNFLHGLPFVNFAETLCPIMSGGEPASAPAASDVPRETFKKSLYPLAI